jgi:two-component system response regulator HydG
MENRAKILVVDDEESIRFTFESFLSDAGHEVATAADFSSALARLDESEFDLVFADIILGGRTGIDVMRVIRDRELASQVVIITGAPQIDTASEALRLGAFDYISKPVDQETLLRVTKTALKHKRLADEKEKFRSNLEAIFRSVKDGIITVDEGLRIVEVNEAAERICGLKRDARGRLFSDVQSNCGKKCLQTLAATIEQKASAEADRLECERAAVPGQVVSISASPLLDHQGMFSGAVIVVSDETRLAGLERDLGERQRFHNLIGRSERMQKIYSFIETLADLQTTVLITGESGTGKELVAEALHCRGGRSAKPLVKVNCAALSESLLESELFGHVKGAFTGAIKDRVGRFQRADGGTIFLDEIGDISPKTQLQLLRVLQEMEFERVGDSAPVRVDVRVIAATNKDLAEKVREREFREDLYYRLKVVEIAIPPLRERSEDIPQLTEHFLSKFNAKLGREVKAVSADVRKIFMEYPWPGNVRELEHTLEHACILCGTGTITREDLPSYFRDFSGAGTLDGAAGERAEITEILSALEKTAGNKAKAARLLGIDRKTLYRKIDKYGIATEKTEM